MVARLSCPTPTKTAIETMQGFQRFLGPQVTPKHVYADGSREFSKALQNLGFSHDTCTPHVKQTSGIVEVMVRKVTEGTSCALTQSGFSVKRWNNAMKCYCFLRNVTDILPSGCTPYQTRFGEFKGHRVPFGAAIEFMLMMDGEVRRQHPLGPKTRK